MAPPPPRPNDAQSKSHFPVCRAADVKRTAGERGNVWGRLSGTDIQAATALSDSPFSDSVMGNKLGPE